MAGTVYVNKEFTADCTPHDDDIGDTGQFTIIDQSIPVGFAIFTLNVDISLKGRAKLASRTSLCLPSDGKGGVDITVKPSGSGTAGGGISARLPWNLAAVGVKGDGTINPKAEVRGAAMNDKVCRDLRQGWDPWRIGLTLWWEFVS